MSLKRGNHLNRDKTFVCVKMTADEIDLLHAAVSHKTG